MRLPLASRLTTLFLLAAPIAAAEPTLVGGGAPGAVVVRVSPGELRVAAAGATHRIELQRGETADSVAPYGDGWLVSGTRAADAGARLVLRRVAASGESIELAAPAPKARLQRDPQLASAPAAAAPTGLAWLEGDRHGEFAVRYASWDGARFSDPVTVAGRPASGSNLALSAAVLADGRTLLAWAGYDGSDDEIWAAIGRGREWTAPFRVSEDNDVPDITPVALAAGRGAVVAWSRFDGREYRLASTRFDGRSFGETSWAAPPGSVFPSVTRDEDGSATGILFLDARSSGWGAVEIDASGRPGRITRIAADDRDRPVVHLGDAGARWELSDRSTTSPWE